MATEQVDLSPRQNPVEERAFSLVRPLIQAEQERDALAKIVSSNPLYFPPIRHVVSDAAKTITRVAKFDGFLTDSSSAYVEKVVHAYMPSSAREDVNLESLTYMTSGRLKTEKEMQALHPVALDMMYDFDSSFKQVLRHDERKLGLTQEVALLFGKYLRESMLGYLTEEAKKKGTNAASLNQKAYLISTFFRSQINTLMRNQITSLLKTSPVDYRQAFGDEDDLSGFNDDLIRQIFGGLKKDKNGINPLLFTNIDVTKYVPEELTAVIGQKYIPLTPAIVEALRNQFNTELQAKGKGNVDLRTYLLDESNLNALLSDFDISEGVSSVVAEVMKKQGRRFKDNHEKNNAVTEVVNAYKLFLRDLHVTQAIRQMQDRIYIAKNSNLEDMTSEDAQLYREFKREENVLVLDANREPFEREVHVALSNFDIVGSTNLKVILAKLKLMNEKEMSSRQVSLLKSLQKYANRFGFKTINKMGDAAIFSAKKIRDKVYFAHKVARDHLNEINQGLQEVLDENIIYLEDEINSLAKRMKNLEKNKEEIDAEFGLQPRHKEQKKSIIDVRFSKHKQDLDTRLVELIREMKREEILSKEGLRLRGGIGADKVVESVDDARDTIGEGINLTNRLGKHEESAGVHDVKITNGEINNVRGYAIAEQSIDELFPQVPDATLKGVYFDNRDIDIIQYTELDGTEIMIRSLGQQPAKIKNFGEQKIYKLVLDDNERLLVDALLNTQMRGDNSGEQFIEEFGHLIKGEVEAKVPTPLEHKASPQDAPEESSVVPTLDLDSTEVAERESAKRLTLELDSLLHSRDTKIE